jgi:Holliday junction resolvasome RuvABC DNA-binding subunit
MQLGYITGYLAGHAMGIALVEVRLSFGTLAYDIIVNDLQGLPDVGKEVSLATWDLGGDEPRTYGFRTLDDCRLAKEIHKRCDGIGPVMAHKILTTLGMEQTAGFILAHDDAGLSKAVKGLGTKKAQSVVTGMADHIGALCPLGVLRGGGIKGTWISQAITTLKGMGFSDVAPPDIGPLIGELEKTGPVDLRRIVQAFLVKQANK